MLTVCWSLFPSIFDSFVLRKYFATLVFVLKPTEASCIIYWSLITWIPNSTNRECGKDCFCENGTLLLNDTVKTSYSTWCGQGNCTELQRETKNRKSSDLRLAPGHVLLFSTLKNKILCMIISRKMQEDSIIRPQTQAKGLGLHHRLENGCIFMFELKIELMLYFLFSFSALKNPIS